MFIILLFSFLVLTILINVRIKDRMSLWIVMSFVCYWFISLCLSTFNPYTLYPVSDRAYFLLILNVFSFVLGFSCISLNPQMVCSYNELHGVINESIKKLLANKLFILFVIFCTIVCLYIYSKYAIFIQFGEGRVDALQEAGKNVGILFIIYQFICSPFFYCVCGLIPYMMLNHKNWKIILLLLIYIVSFSINGGGRTNFLVLFIGIFFIRYVGKDIFYRRKKNVSKTLYVIIGVLFLFMYFTMAWLSSIRAGKDTFSWDTLMYGCDILNKDFITYSLLPFRLFDNALNSNYLETIGMQYGFSTLDGLNRYAYIILKKMGINIQLVSSITTQYFQENYFWVGEDISANYAYTNVIYHYLDYGVLGVFVFPFLFGVSFKCAIKKFYKNASLAGFFLLFYLFYVLIHTVFSWHIQKMYSLGFIIIMIVFLYKKRNLS